MYKICNINVEQYGKILEQIEEYCQEVKERLNPQAIILFGSFAKGDINEASDIDIMVIADFKESPLDRIKLLLDLNKFRLPIEPIGYTPEEFRQMRARRNRFIEEVVESCRVIYGQLPL